MMHAFSPREGSIESFFSFIQSPLDELCGINICFTRPRSMHIFSIPFILHHFAAASENQGRKWGYLTLLPPAAAKLVSILLSKSYPLRK